MPRAVEIVRIEEIDRGVVELGRTSFGRPAEAYRDYLDWKYLRNPYRSDPLLYVARDAAGTTIGMRGFYGARWMTPSGVMDIPCADDFAVARQHRTSGVASALMRAALVDLANLGIRYVVNASGGHVTVLQSLAMGWKSIVTADPLDRPAVPRPGTTFNRLRARARPLHRSLAWLDDSDGVAATPDAERLAALVGTTSDGGVRHVRDPAFFHWRYANPEREYRFLVAESDSRVTGYLAIGRQRPRPDTLPLFFADWEGESAAIRASLLERAVELCGSAVVRVWAPSAPEETRSDLGRLGFEPAQHELRARGLPCVLFRSLESHDPDATTAIEQSSWDVRLIDSMHG